MKLKTKWTDTWRANSGTSPTPLFDRGFTGHEHLDGFQLINMNGRIYDPVVSRMLAPDNFVQTPDFSQNFNRYSYALNNPLMFTDPSGELLFLFPHISFSNGGVDFGLTFVVGVPGVLSAQATIGHSTGSNNTYFTVGGTASGFTASAGWGTQTGYTISAGTGLGLPIPGFGSNLTSVGISWSQNGGMSAGAFGFTMDSYGMGFNPNLGYSYGFSLNKASVTAPAMLACDDCITLPEVVVIGSRWTVGHGPVSDNTYMAPYQFSYAPRQSRSSGYSTSYYQWADRANTLYNLYNPNPISKTFSRVNTAVEGLNKFDKEDYLGVALTIAEFLLDRNGYVTIYKTVADLANSPQTQRQVSIILQQDAQYHYQMYQRTGSTWHYNEYMRYRSAIETARSKF